MKRFWLVLLSLGLIAAFSTSAMAVDVKVSGEFFAAGMYLNSNNIYKDQGQSTAFYYQRLRLKTDFIATPGLMLTVRADVMDRQWGTRAGATTVYDSAVNRQENENIALDWMYATYVSKIGIFQVGYMNDYAWGTQFGDRSKPDPKIAWTKAFGPVAVGLQIVKEVEGSRTAVVTAPTGIDRDTDGYIGFVNYSFKNGAVGYLFRHNRNANYVLDLTALGYPAPFDGQMMKTYSHLPYAKLKFGPVAVEAEVAYTHGSIDFNNLQTRNTVQIDSWSAYLNANADFGIAYVGGTFAYLPGQINPGESGLHTRKTGLMTGGTDWNPCLIMWNNERSYQAGAIMAGGNVANNTDGIYSTGMSNAYFFQAKGGVRPVANLEINLAVAYANAVVKPAGFLYNDYGWEVDATATYKITNNLSYMLGGGYLFTGKMAKGPTEGQELQNDYLVVNKLTLTF